MELLLALFAGIFSGFLIGLIPGLSVSFVIILSLPFLGYFDLLQLLTFYLAVLSSSQYSETIVALLLGVPGESTSLPVVEARKDINEKDISQTLYNCATGSFVGSMLSVVITMIVFYFLKDSTFYLKTWFMLFVVSAGLILATISSDNRWYETLAMMAFGWALSKIGYDSNTGKDFLTFDNTYLYGGIPTISVLVSLFILPNLLAIPSYVSSRMSYKYHPASLRMVPWAASMRGTIVGYLTGLIPYVGSIISSNISYFIEKKMRSPVPSQVTAAETANNAAFFSVIAPMLIFGIAIVPTQGMLLEVIAKNLIKFDWNAVEKIMLSLAGIMVLINAINWIINIKAISLALKLSSIPINQIKIFGLLASILGAAYMGHDVGQMWYYVIAMACLAPLGYLAKGKDMLPLIFVFLLQSEVEFAIVRLWSMIL
jgi:putative tricarboxylic transport membrane protein